MSATAISERRHRMSRSGFGLVIFMSVMHLRVKSSVIRCLKTGDNGIQFNTKSRMDQSVCLWIVGTGSATLFASHAESAGITGCSWRIVYIPAEGTQSVVQIPHGTDITRNTPPCAHAMFAVCRKWCGIKSTSRLLSICHQIVSAGTACVE